MRWAFVICIGAVFAFGCNVSLRFDEPDEPVADEPAPDASLPVVTPQGCSASADCRLAELRCDLPSGACVECLANADCDHGKCDLAQHRCVECLATTDCPGDERCEPTAQICVDRCDEQHDCDPPSHCRLGPGICVECEENVDCSSSPRGPLCNAAAGRCARCLDDSQCTGAAPRCDRSEGRCVACLQSSDCPTSAPLCAPASLTCVSG